MNTGPLQAIVQRLRRAAAPGVGSPSDGELLSRYVTAHDDAAFAEIVQRHGPLVWALCRSSLPAADADDAFQATFLVLVRQAHRIRKPASLACWLSGVARRAVQQVRRQATRRRRAEMQAEVRAETSDDSGRQDWRDVLNEELGRLPEKYRLPTLLCYYQGLTNEEAARRLSWPHGTVRGRLARAQELLRRRLARRGMTLTVGAIAAGAASPPAELLAATVRMCGRVVILATSQGAVRDSVIQLAEGVMYTVWLTKLKACVLGSLVVVALGGGIAGWTLDSTPAQSPEAALAPPAVEPPPQPGPRPAIDTPPKAGLDVEAVMRALDEVVRPSSLAQPSPADDDVLKLQKERHLIAIREFAARTKRFMVGAREETIDVYLDSLRRVVESEVDLKADPAAHAVAYERWVKAAKAIVDVNQTRFENGRIAIQDLERSRYAHATAQIKLRQAQRTAERLRR